MVFSRLSKAFRSIHTRLLLVIIVSGLGIHLLMLAALYAHRAIVADAFSSSIAQYVRYLVKDLGVPPDFHRAVELAGHTGMTIHYFSPEDVWSTTGQPPRVPVERLHTRHDAGPIQAGRFHGHHYFTYQVDPERRLLFEIVGGPAKDHKFLWMPLLLFLLVTLVLVGSYAWIRRIMAPIRPLTQGVRQVGEGRLDYRVAVGCRDELGELASAFNWMTERLRTLIRSKDRMLVDVSHELRSPLTRMKVALEMSPDGPLKASLAEDLSEMEGMVTTILANARAQSGNPTLQRQRVDLIALIEETIGPLADQPPGVRLHDLPESAQAFLDPERAKTVLRNVIDNAVKYSKESSAPVRISVCREGDFVCVEIQDDGVGVPEQDLPFVFEPFYRVDRSRSRETGGFGLGLSLCKAIMEAHDGSISMQSTEGEGTLVHLRFPNKMPLGT